MIRQLLQMPRMDFERVCSNASRYAYLGNNIGLSRILVDTLCYVDTTDTSVAPHLIMDGYWEAWVTLALRQLPADARCIDVGANHGYFTLLLGKLCATVEAFEPQPALADLLNRSVNRNGLSKKVTVIQAAVGDTNGQVIIEPDPTDPWNTGCRRVRSVNNESEETTALCLSLDAKYPDDSFDFIKIDAEGYERRVWNGMLGILGRSAPTVLMEFTPRLYEEEEAGAAKEFLRQLQNYAPLCTVGDDGRVREVPRAEVLDSSMTMLWLDPYGNGR